MCACVCVSCGASISSGIPPWEREDRRIDIFSFTLKHLFIVWWIIFDMAVMTVEGEITPCRLRPQNLCIEACLKTWVGFHQFQHLLSFFSSYSWVTFVSCSVCFPLPFKLVLSWIGEVRAITPKHLVLCTCLGAKIVKKLLWDCPWDREQCRFNRHTSAVV